MKDPLKTPEAIRDQIWRELSRAAARQKKSQKRNFCILEQETKLATQSSRQCEFVFKQSRSSKNMVASQTNCNQHTLL
jgi:hypothetical protein